MHVELKPPLSAVYDVAAVALVASGHQHVVACFMSSSSLANPIPILKVAHCQLPQTGEVADGAQGMAPSTALTPQTRRYPNKNSRKRGAAGHCGRRGSRINANSFMAHARISLSLHRSRSRENSPAIRPNRPWPCAATTLQRQASPQKTSRPAPGSPRIRGAPWKAKLVFSQGSSRLVRRCKAALT